MDIADLNADERCALVGLLKMVVTSDSKVSDEELGHIEDVIDAVGEDGYDDALDAFEDRFDGKGDAFKAFLKTIKGQDARELIFGTVLEAAGAEAVEPGEAELIDWLAKAWDVKIEIDEADDQS